MDELISRQDLIDIMVENGYLEKIEDGYKILNDAAGLIFKVVPIDLKKLVKAYIQEAL